MAGAIGASAEAAQKGASCGGSLSGGELAIDDLADAREYGERGKRCPRGITGVFARMAADDRERTGNRGVFDHARHFVGGIVPGTARIAGRGAARSGLWRSQDGTVWCRDSEGASQVSERSSGRRPSGESDCSGGNHVAAAPGREDTRANRANSWAAAQQRSAHDRQFRGAWRGRI